MRKWLFWTFLPVAVLAGAILWKSGTCQTAAEQCAATNASKQQPQSSVEANESCNRSHVYLCQVLTPANLPSVLLVLVGIGGIIVAVGSLNILEKQTEAARETAEAARKSAETASQSAAFAETVVKVSERANILLDRASIMLSETKIFGHDSRLALIFKNFGRTRADQVVYYARIIIPNYVDFLPEPTPLSVLGAGQDQLISFQSFGEFLTEATFSDISQGRIEMRFESWIVYKDVFGSSYTTRDVGIFNHKTHLFRVQESIVG